MSEYKIFEALETGAVYLPLVVGKGESLMQGVKGFFERNTLHIRDSKRELSFKKIPARLKKKINQEGGVTILLVEHMDDLDDFDIPCRTLTVS